MQEQQQQQQQQRQQKMYRSYQNLLPVTNKYLAQKKFEKEQENYKIYVKNVHGLIDQSAPTPRQHCFERTREKLIKEHELAMIEHENQRLNSRMSTNGAYVNSHNDYVAHSLNIEKRHRDEAQHKTEITRLRKQINKARTNYSTRQFEHDFAKQQDFKQRISRYPSNNK